jgi:hypothetical protein
MMQDEPFTTEDGIPIEVSLTVADRRARFAPREPMPYEPPPAAPPKPPPSFAERVDALFERLERNVGPQETWGKFALLPSIDQERLLRTASDADFVQFARHARPPVRARAQEERRQRQRPDRTGP